MNILEWLQAAQLSLKGTGSRSSRLDAEILLEYVTKMPRSKVLANLSQSLDPRQIIELDKLLKKRRRNYPIAYVTGVKEFYGRQFRVTGDVLIPRPESEAIISLALENPAASGLKVLDVGTGSGCLAITLKKERPRWKVTANDISLPALEIAQANAKRLRAQIEFIQSDLLDNIKSRFDLIVANLPYLPPNYPLNSDAQHEPAQALFSPNQGLEHYQNLFKNLPQHLNKGGRLIIEANPEQHQELTRTAKTSGLTPQASKGLALAFNLL
jgi:release factor glutamine methyltransferase